MLQVINLSRREGRTQILADISFDWARGVLGVVGGNGSGKTTLLRVLAGAKAPDSGQASWDGVPIAKAVRQSGKISYGPQERSLDLAITLREFLALCVDLRGLSDRAARIKAVTEELGLEAQIDERLVNLSGGGRRKAMTAQALLGEPDLIILDEPTSEIDYAASRRFWTAFQARGQKAALVIATHDVELALAKADSLLLLQAGKAPRLGPVDAFTLDELSSAIGDL